jgi:hypothetical protein
MEATKVTTRATPCGSSLPELEVPMINTLVTCLGSEHRKLNAQNMQLAFVATRLANSGDSASADRGALRVWDDIRHDLWSHLQIEDELVFSWGEAHQAISDALLDTLKNERQEMRKLMNALRAFSPGEGGETLTARDRAAFAKTLVTLASTLDSHVERYDAEVLPSILRAVFHKERAPAAA